MVHHIFFLQLLIFVLFSELNNLLKLWIELNFYEIIFYITVLNFSIYFEIRYNYISE